MGEEKDNGSISSMLSEGIEGLQDRLAGRAVTRPAGHWIRYTVNGDQSALIKTLIL